MPKSTTTSTRQTPRKVAGRGVLHRYPPPTEDEIRAGIRCGPDCPMPHIPNAETIAAMREAERGENMKRFANFQEYLKYCKSIGLL